MALQVRLPACAGCSWGRVLPAPTQTDAGQWEPFPRQSAGGFCLSVTSNEMNAIVINFI